GFKTSIKRMKIVKMTKIKRNKEIKNIFLISMKMNCSDKIKSLYSLFGVMRLSSSYSSMLLLLNSLLNSSLLRIFAISLFALPFLTKFFYCSFENMISKNFGVQFAQSLSTQIYTVSKDMISLLNNFSLTWSTYVQNLISSYITNASLQTVVNTFFNFFNESMQNLKTELNNV
ncbi:MAG: hypothetical protein WBA74_26050, partial [Cyclobacteriaceae bacterium]